MEPLRILALPTPAMPGCHAKIIWSSVHQTGKSYYVMINVIISELFIRVLSINLNKSPAWNVSAFGHKGS